MTIKSKGRGHVRPGDEVTISVKAASYSDVALLAVDKGLYILNNKNKLTQDQVIYSYSSCKSRYQSFNIDTCLQITGV